MPSSGQIAGIDDGTEGSWIIEPSDDGGQDQTRNDLTSISGAISQTKHQASASSRDQPPSGSDDIRRC